MRGFFRLFRSRLLFRLILVNIIGMLILATGMLLVSEVRQALVEAHKQNLISQARLTASALGDAASDGKFQFLPGPSLLGPLFGDRMMPDWRIAEAAEIMRRLASGTNNRVRLYARDGRLLVDSAAVSRDGTVIFRDLPPLPEATDHGSILDRLAHWFDIAVRRTKVPVLDEEMALNGSQLPEIRVALRGATSTAHRLDERGRDLYSVTVPVQSYRAIIGAVMVTSKPDELREIIAAERRNIIELLGVAILVTIIVSYLLVRTISEPIGRLAQAARAFAKPAGQLPPLESIPDLSSRSDEIGGLSVDIRLMVMRLLERLNAIDQFAADVAHELKNPLTSLHSAVQSLTLAKTAADRRNLMGIIEQDVARLNRLISDISAASRLDAALSRDEVEAFNLSDLLADMVEARATTLAQQHNIKMTFKCDDQYVIRGQKPQISQVIDNLLANAISFSPVGGQVTITLRPAPDAPGRLELNVSDEGPGLAAGTEERIFERFYSDRHKAYHEVSSSGHSGLGLSISRQIARVHGGDLRAYNRPDGVGAFFQLTLPRGGA